MLILLLYLPTLTLTCVAGGWEKYKDNDEILEYRESDGWRKVGAMKVGRSNFATSVVAYDQFKYSCI